MKEIIPKSLSERRRDFMKSEIDVMEKQLEAYKRETETTKQLCMIFKTEIKKVCEKYDIPEPDLGPDPKD